MDVNLEEYSERIQEPEEITVPDSSLDASSIFERYRRDGVYQYPLREDGKPDNRRATIKFNNGTVYDGELKSGTYEGKGKFIWSDGSVYDGEFKGGKISGAGKYTSADGDSYEGEFKGGKYNGVGKYTWSDGSVFYGEFKGGKMISGTLTDAKGNYYKCDFTYSIFSGERQTGKIELMLKASENAPEEKLEDTPGRANEEKLEVTPGKANEQKLEVTPGNANEEKLEVTPGNAPGEKLEDTPGNANGKAKVSRKEYLAGKGLTPKDDTVIAAIRKSALGGRFKTLYGGAGNGGEKDEKELITILNFFTNSNAEQIERIYKSSALYDSGNAAGIVQTINQTVERSKNYSQQMHDKSVGKGKFAVNAAAKKSAEAVR